LFPGGGVSRERDQWVSWRRGFFLPVRVLSRRFRRLFQEGLERAFDKGQLQFFSGLQALADPAMFRAQLAPLWATEWVVYAKPPFGGPTQVLEYLGRYTHRVAIANERLISLEQGQVSFRWKDYRRSQRPRTLTLKVEELFAASCCTRCLPAFSASATTDFFRTAIAARLSLCAADCWRRPSPSYSPIGAATGAICIWRSPASHSTAASLRYWPDGNYGNAGPLCASATSAGGLLVSAWLVPELWRCPPGNTMPRYVCESASAAWYDSQCQPAARRLQLMHARLTGLARRRLPTLCPLPQSRRSLAYSIPIPHVHRAV
jgi:hypothetical protein